MTSKIKRWGNSMAIRLPQSVVAEAGLREGMSMKMEARKGRVVLSRAGRKEVRLADLLKRWPKSQRAPEGWPDDKPRGSEAW